MPNSVLTGFVSAPRFSRPVLKVLQALQSCPLCLEFVKLILGQNSPSEHTFLGKFQDDKDV